MRPKFNYKINKTGQLQLWWNCPVCNKTIKEDILVCDKCGTTVRSQPDVIHAYKQKLAAREWYQEQTAVSG